MPLIILHGWSDSSASFARLAGHLAQAGVVEGGDIRRIALGDYLSMSDDLRFDDLQAALDRAWDDHGLPRAPYSCDVIVHSTSALIVRDWLTRHFPVDASPVKRLVMLAPANFGSPLAHVGRSMLGRAMKGFVRRQGGRYQDRDMPRVRRGRSSRGRGRGSSTRWCACATSSMPRCRITCWSFSTPAGAMAGHWRAASTARRS